MELFFQLTSIGIVLGLTFLFFSMAGPVGRGLLYTKKEGQIWYEATKGAFGGYLTASNILATLTSLATVYVFFIGTSKVFGWWIFVCCISLIIGGGISNAITNRILKLERPRSVIHSDSQSGAVVASLFWSEDKEAQRVSSLVRGVSLASIAAVVWLEFAVFADISGHLLGLGIAGKVLIAVGISLCIFFFTFKFGLRGFVIADLIHTPLVALATLTILAGAIALLIATVPVNLASLWTLGTPIVDTTTGLLFAAHVLVGNSFWILVSESHWLRMWLFPRKEIEVQIPSLVATSVVWFLLILVGLSAGAIANGKVEVNAVAVLLTRLDGISYAFGAAFWIGGAAALFSTADVQIYCFRLVQSFNVRAGKIPEDTKTISWPGGWALLLGVLTGAVYFLVRHLSLPLEKLLFTLVPLVLNLLPAFCQLAFKRKVTTAPIIVSLTLYAGFSIIGFLQPTDAFAWTLGAAVAPAVVAGAAVLFARGR